MLYLVSTPIGNLGDLTFRAKEILSKVDQILCEDTRRTSILLAHLEIKKPLIAFHKFTEKRLEEKVLQDLRAGLSIACVSDAGTPLLSDPGHSLVRRCIEEEIPFTAIPGPASPIQALLLSGFEPHPFQFVGFLSKGRQELCRYLAYPGTTLFFESPERLLATLLKLQQLDPNRKVAVAREMTKLHEECRRGTPSELIRHFEATPPRGEITVVLAGGSPPDDATPEDLVAAFIEYFGLSKQEAIKRAAELAQVPKRDLYKKLC